MDRDKTPTSINDLLSALADGELDLREHPDALTRIAADPQSAQRIAYLQQLKQTCSKAMDEPGMKCPDELAAKLREITGESVDAEATAAPIALTQGVAGARPAIAGQSSPVIARIGRWAPAAVAAVLMIAALVIFTQSSTNPGAGDAAQLLSVSQIQQFDTRHGVCAAKPESLKKHEDFGDPKDLEQLPDRLADYFKTSADGIRLDLKEIDYQYELTGACSLPGSGAVHIVYHHNQDPDRSISLWLSPAEQKHDALEPDRVYVQAGKNLDRPVIVWRSGSMVYYLMGNSLKDAQDAFEVLNNPA